VTWSYRDDLSENAGANLWLKAAGHHEVYRKPKTLAKLILQCDKRKETGCFTERDEHIQITVRPLLVADE
jgi:hypothetical protein